MGMLLASPEPRFGRNNPVDGDALLSVRFFIFPLLTL
jgi:hypothetical protein